MGAESTTTNKKDCAPIFSIVGPQEFWFPLSWSCSVPANLSYRGPLPFFISSFLFPIIFERCNPEHVVEKAPGTPKMATLRPASFWRRFIFSLLILSPTTLLCLVVFVRSLLLASILNWRWTWKFNSKGTSLIRGTDDSNISSMGLNDTLNKT